MDYLTLDVDEDGLWLLSVDENGLEEQLGHVSWYVIAKRVEQELSRKECLNNLAKLDEKDGLV